MDLDELAEMGQLGDKELAKRRKAQREAEKETAKAQKLMSHEERTLHQMKVDAKKAFVAKQREQMELRKPEASLLLMRRDEGTGQIRLAGGEAHELM